MKQKGTSTRFWRTDTEFLFASFSLAVLTFIAFRLHAPAATVAVLFFFFIVLISLWVGFVTSVFICLQAILCFDYFFTEPLFELRMSDPLDLVALIAFSSSAFVITRMMSRVEERTTALRKTNEQLRVEIVERKEAEERLRQREAELRHLVDAVPQHIFVLEPDGRFSYANQRDLDYTGLTLEDVLAPDFIARVFHPDDLPRLWPRREQAIARGVPWESEARLLGKSGQYRWFLIRLNPLRDEQGRIVRWYGTRTDIEDRKRAEEANSKAQADLTHVTRIMTMGELAASIAHEVNQPISAIVINGNSCLRWLAGEVPNLDEAREAAGRIVRDGKRAGDIIARIRALAKKTGAVKGRLDMNEAIREVVALAGYEVRRNGVTLRLELADDLSPVSGDRVQLQQVLLNLIMNGVEAMSTVGERPRELVIRTQNDDADHVRVTVQDSGTGLDPQSLERIFDAFYTTKRGGMGMGLSISRSIIQNHGGRLWAAANDSPGTTLHFTVQKDR